MRDLEMSMQEKNNRFQREKHSLQIENKRLQEEIEKVSSPHGGSVFMALSRCVSREGTYFVSLCCARQFVHVQEH